MHRGKLCSTSRRRLAQREGQGFGSPQLHQVGRLRALSGSRLRRSAQCLSGNEKVEGAAQSLMATMSAMASGRRLLVAMLVLFVCDVIGGLLAVVSGIATWGEAWGFDTTFTVPLPVGAAQLVLAWLAARNVRPPVGLIAAVVLSVFCLSACCWVVRR